MREGTGRCWFLSLRFILVLSLSKPPSAHQLAVTPCGRVCYLVSLSALRLRGGGGRRVNFLKQAGPDDDKEVSEFNPAAKTKGGLKRSRESVSQQDNSGALEEKGTKFKQPKATKRPDKPANVVSPQKRGKQRNSKLIASPDEPTQTQTPNTDVTDMQTDNTALERTVVSRDDPIANAQNALFHGEDFTSAEDSVSSSLSDKLVIYTGGLKDVHGGDSGPDADEDLDDDDEGTTKKGKGKGKQHDGEHSNDYDDQGAEKEEEGADEEEYSRSGSEKDADDEEGGESDQANVELDEVHGEEEEEVHGEEEEEEEGGGEKVGKAKAAPEYVDGLDEAPKVNRTGMSWNPYKGWHTPEKGFWERADEAWDIKRRTGRRVGFHLKADEENVEQQILDKRRRPRGKNETLRFYPVYNPKMTYNYSIGLVHKESVRNGDQEDEANNTAAKVPLELLEDQHGRYWTRSCFVETIEQKAAGDGDEAEEVAPVIKTRYTVEPATKEELESWFGDSPPTNSTCMKDPAYQVKQETAAWDDLTPTQLRQKLQMEAVEYLKEGAGCKKVAATTILSDEDKLSIWQLLTHEKMNMSNFENFTDAPLPPTMMPHHTTIKYVDNDGVELLRDASKGNLTAITQRRFLVGFRDRKGWTALHYAVLFGQTAAVRAILLCGANPSPVNCMGITPSELSCLYDTDDPAEQMIFEKIQDYLQHVSPRAPLNPSHPTMDISTPLRDHNITEGNATRRVPHVITSQRSRVAAAHPTVLPRSGILFTGPNAFKRAQYSWATGSDGCGEYVMGGPKPKRIIQ